MEPSLLLTAWLLGAGGAAQPQPPAITASPAVTFSVRLAGDRQEFRPGEIIPIELEFDSGIPARFVVSGATYDRSGRLTIDEFRISPPDGVSDPLLDFYAAQPGGFIGGGLSSTHALGDQPVVVQLELNQWFRFDRPGRYTLSVRSSRVTDQARRTSTDRGILPVHSNALAFDIVPADAAWDSARVAEAMALLESESPVERRRGCRMLRFLGTEAAVEEMIRRFEDEQQACGGFDFMVGLFGAPNRAHVVRRLEERLTAPDQAVSVRYLRTLAALSLYLQHPEMRPSQTPDNIGRIVQGELGRRQDLLDAALERYMAILAPALESKGPRARAFSLAELLNALSPGAVAAPAGVELKRQVAESFLELPLDRQRTMLEHQWRRFGGPAMLPALRHIVSVPRAASSPAFDLALRRLHELSPEEARPLILDEIRDPRRGATVATLGSLPDRELPELDDALAAGLASGDDPDGLRAGLLDRYASAAVARRVLAIVESQPPRPSCLSQASLITYFLRAAPAAGRHLLERALSARSRGGCYRTLLTEVAARRATPEWEAVAIAHLDDPAPEVVANAAEALGRHGTPAALPALRARFDRWSRAWAGRQEDLVYRDLPPDSTAVHAMVEFSLVQALGRGSSWHMDRARLVELGSFCVTDACRRQVEQLIEESERRVIRVHWQEQPDRPSISIGQYDLRSVTALEQKLAQYPRGTSFTLDVSALDPEAASAVTARVMAAARAAGLNVSR